MPKDSILLDTNEAQRFSTDEEESRVTPRHASSLIVLRQGGAGPEILMGMRGAGHRFMPNCLVFPGGAVDPEDMDAPTATALRPDTRHHLGKAADDRLVHGLGVACARELKEETGLTLGSPAALRGLHFLCRMVTPPELPVRFNARFLVIDSELVSGTIAGSGELEKLRYFALEDALARSLAVPTREVLNHFQLFLAMSPAEREARQTTPVFTRRHWNIE